VNPFLTFLSLHPFPSVIQAESESGNGRVVEDMEGAAAANQRRMNADPLEVMLLNMGYRITGLSGRGPEGSDDEDSSDGQVQCRPS
jgi:WD and tetratricopeptide repeat-containing protein 1